MCEGEPTLDQPVRKIRRIKIHPDTELLRPRDPALKLLGGQRITIDLLAVEFRVGRVQVDPLRPRDERTGPLEIRPQFRCGARAAEIVPRHRNPVAQGAAGAVETADIVALPAVHRNRNPREIRQRAVGIDAECGVALTRQFVGLCDGL